MHTPLTLLSPNDLHVCVPHLHTPLTLHTLDCSRPWSGIHQTCAASAPESAMPPQMWPEPLQTVYVQLPPAWTHGHVTAWAHGHLTAWAHGHMGADGQGPSRQLLSAIDYIDTLHGTFSQAILSSFIGLTLSNVRRSTSPTATSPSCRIAELSSTVFVYLQQWARFQCIQTASAHRPIAAVSYVQKWTNTPS